jgi:2'-5' RNA ligase superfamily
MPFSAGQAAVILPVPDAEPVVSRWRRRRDPSAALGVPAHITVIYPWLPLAEITPADRAALLALFAARPALEIGFESCGRFPGALYLVPSPEDGLLGLVAAMVDRWPSTPPYGGAIALADLVPHLTIAQSEDPAHLDRAERGVREHLPIRTVLHEGLLMSFDGGRWRRELALPLRPRAQEHGR